MVSVSGFLKAGVFAVAAGLLGGCTGGPPSDALPPATATLPPSEPEDGGPPSPSSIRLIGVGDVMLGTNFPEEKHLNPDLVPDADLASLIGEDLLRLLNSGDITFGNLEGSLFDGDGEHKPCRDPKSCYVFRSPEHYAGYLRDMGFDAMSLANNHAGDFLEAGRAATMAALGRNGIVFAGVDEPGVQTGTLVLDGGIRVGLAAFAPNRGTVNINDHERAIRIVKALGYGHDIVVVSFHGGAEGAAMTHVPRELEVFHGEHRGDVYRFAHDLIDAGADVVLGHGPHVPRAVEVYRGRFIAYSLGNFWTYGRFNLQDLAGIAPVVDLTLSSEDGRLLDARIHSVRQEGWGVPHLDPTGAALHAVAELTAADFPESTLRFAEDGRVTGFSEPLVGWFSAADTFHRPAQ